MLEKKFAEKATLKRDELEHQKEKLEFEKRKYEDEAKERSERLAIELEERKVFLAVLRDKL